MNEDENFDNLNVEKKELNVAEFFKMTAIPIALVLVFLIYSIIMYSVSKKEFDNGKKEHNVISEPSKYQIAFMFLINILFALTIGTIIIMCHRDSQLIIKTNCSNCVWISTLTLFSFFTVAFYVFSLIFGFIEIYNPSNAKMPQEIFNYTNFMKSHDLMGYVYRVGRIGKNNHYYSEPVTFKLHLGDYNETALNESNLPDMFAIDIINKDNYNETVEDVFKNITDVIISKDLFKNKIYSSLEYVRYGIYPFYEDSLYSSKTGKLTGKFGKSSRFASIFLGIATFYEHVIKSVPYYKYEINRTAEIIEPFNYSSINTSLIRGYNPDFEYYYNKLYGIV